VTSTGVRKASFTYSVVASWSCSTVMRIREGCPEAGAASRFGPQGSWPARA
jgi:hypothetical protein